MQDKTWYSILGLDAEPLFLQDHMLKRLLVHPKRILILERKLHFLAIGRGGSGSAEAAASVNESALKLYVVSSIKYLPTCLFLYEYCSL